MAPTLNGGSDRGFLADLAVSARLDTQQAFSAWARAKQSETTNAVGLLHSAYVAFVLILGGYEFLGRGGCMTGSALVP
jgi:hypothetical protein